MKTRLAALLVAVLLLLPVGCQGLEDWLYEKESAPGGALPSPTAAPTLPTSPPRNGLFGVPWSGLSTVAPLVNDNRFDAQWLPLVYEGLFALDEQFQPQPALCTRYTTADNRVFLFTLRSGVLFHDGAPLTAEDAAWSLNAAKASPLYAARLADMVSARAADEMTLEVTLARADPRLPALLTTPIVPALSAAGGGPVPGTGPYRPVTDAEFPHLAAQDAWWGTAKPLIERLELVPAASGDKLIYAFETRALSLAVYNPSDPTGVNFRGDYETWPYDTPILEFVGFNTARKPLDDPLLRQALAAAVDRDTAAKTEGRGVAAVLPIPTVSPLYNASLAGAYGFDLSRASTLLRGLGYEDHDSDGLLDLQSGWRLYPLTLNLLVCGDNTLHLEAARRIADTMAGIGVDIQLTPLPLTAFRQALAKGAFDLYYGQVTLAPNFAPTLFFAGGALGYGGYKDPETLALWGEAAAALSGSEAQTAFWRRFLEEAPIAPVLFERQSLLTQRGLVVKPGPTWDNLFFNLAQWGPED
ncbi:MAG: ABC transporter substrate-binding protein [Oscillospiraceae bacterium]|jgi:ABC-type transport system substrate-binding protein|nr:ABC transporter substrate-binding protein [Oscillospiraceae bacterium]